ncbi:DNA gyrase subunit A [Desulfobotulus mexicanus]|uniref:DNA gyrase subunit A n=1 Tax=Desulfobotulus mexicanus TaxID=2586642 RepID=A0A5Q4VCV2_9BACT|nr:DNA gyrase subunit A [Desulfobotulus mexicanus]TYT74798.1 DNA gyrase subunit A [Desulfobotulus mexicanus]
MIDTELGSEISIEKEMRQSYLEYAMSVIIGRALPDVRDGLKPVHRRVLFAMRELKNDWNRPYKKSARIVGDVIGKYHPHGDTAVYDTIVRMAQNFSMRYPLVDGQGNFGSIDGDSPAAMRYTEIRMQRLAQEMLADLDKETVEFITNYDESLEEPLVLPTRFPALLVNGSSGIAVGMATNIPPHNLREVADAIIAVIENPEIDVTELLSILPGPDFPTGGIIYGKSGIVEAYRTGRGIIRVRALLDLETDSQNVETLVVKELPYQVNKARLVKAIHEMVRDKLLEGISYIRDESDRDGMRIAIGLKKDAMHEVVLNQLFKHTQLQNSFGIIFLAVVNNRPEVLTLKEMLIHFIRHRKEVIIRRTRYDLKKAQARAHILEGLKIALDNIDEVVALIRKSSSPVEAKEGLMTRFGLSALQSQAILDMRLQRLTGLERDRILEEYDSIMKDIAWFKEILGSETIVMNLIKEELVNLKEEFGDSRRSEIVESTREIGMEDLIAEEDMVVTLTRTGYIKRNPITLYQSQRRGGRGKTAMTTRDEDFVTKLFVASTHHTFLFFTNLGKVYWSKVWELPQGGRTSRGKAIVNFLDLAPDEKLSTVLAVPEFEEGRYILMTTRNGLVKKTDLMAYSRRRAGGIIAIDLVEGDALIAARITDGSKEVLLTSAQGQAIRFSESDVRPMGRVSRGVRGLRMAEDDYIVGMEVTGHGSTLFTATENGYGKRTEVEAFPMQRRGGKGVIGIRTDGRNGKVVAMVLTDESDDVMLVSDKGRLIRMAACSISVIGRATQGVRLIQLEEAERLIDAARLDEEAQEDGDTVNGEGDGGECAPVDLDQDE